MLFAEVSPCLGEHVVHLIGLYRENNHFGELQHIRIKGRGFRADLARKRLARGFDWIAGHEVLRPDKLRMKEAFGQGGGHLARAEKTNFELRYHGRVVTLTLPKLNGKFRVPKPFTPFGACATLRAI